MNGALEPTCYLAVLRALELACRRRKTPDRNSRIAIPGIPAHQTHMHVRLAQSEQDVPRLIDGAFTLLATTLDRFGYDHAGIRVVVEQVQAYTTQLILLQREPDPKALHTWIVTDDHVDA